MNETFIGGSRKTAPSTWAELTEKQLITWVKLCEKEIDPSHAIMFASAVFYGIKKKLYFKLNAAQQVVMADDFKYLLHNKLTAWIIPSVKIGRFKSLIGPSDYLSTSSIREFSNAETYYHAYLLKKEEAYLDMLIATLYRPASSVNNGKDLRSIFAEIEVQQNAGKVKALDKHLKAAILFNYEGCRASIISRYPTIFKKGDGQPTKQLPDLGLIIKTIAGGKFGTYKETEHTDLYVFLDHWRDEQEAYERAKNEAAKK